MIETIASNYVHQQTKIVLHETASEVQEHVQAAQLLDVVGDAMS
jgi:hypothetical protein